MLTPSPSQRPNRHQLASATHVFLGLLYAELVGRIYFALSCRVSRVVLLCEKECDNGGVDGMGTMGGVGTAWGFLVCEHD